MVFISIFWNTIPLILIKSIFDAFVVWFTCVTYFPNINHTVSQIFGGAMSSGKFTKSSCCSYSHFSIFNASDSNAFSFWVESFSIWFDKIIMNKNPNRKRTVENDESQQKAFPLFWSKFPNMFKSFICLDLSVVFHVEIIAFKTKTNDLIISAIGISEIELIIDNHQWRLCSSKAFTSINCSIFSS